jgi:hypothetical protein
MQIICLWLHVQFQEPLCTNTKNFTCSLKKRNKCEKTSCNVFLIVFSGKIKHITNKAEFIKCYTVNLP